MNAITLAMCYKINSKKQLNIDSSLIGFLGSSDSTHHSFKHKQQQKGKIFNIKLPYTKYYKIEYECLAMNVTIKKLMV